MTQLSVIFKLVLLALITLPTTSCQKKSESGLSEIVGTSEGETFTRRNDSPFSVRRVGPSGENEVFGPKSGQTRAQFTIYRRYTVYHQEKRRFLDYRYVDSDEKKRAPGTEAAWNGYFANDVPQRDRPDLLKSAVKGIGEARAEAIVAFTHTGAPLSKRPVGWDAFKDEIEKIDKLFENKEKYSHLRGIYKDVVGDNGSQNIAALGYQVPGQELEQFWNERIFEWAENKETVEGEYSWKSQVAIRAQGVRLLPTETETFTVYVSKSSEDDAYVTVDSNFGNYKVTKTSENGQIRFDLKGQRIAARPENRIDVSVRKQGAESISVDFSDAVASQLGEFAGDVRVSFSVRRDTNKWFTEKNLGDHTINLNGSKGSKTIPVPKLKSGENFSVTWSIQRQNSSAYDPSKSSDSRSQSVSVN